MGIGFIIAPCLEFFRNTPVSRYWEENRDRLFQLLASLLLQVQLL